MNLERKRVKYYNLFVFLLIMTYFQKQYSVSIKHIALQKTFENLKQSILK